MPVPLSALLREPLLAVFPHGLQHHARRNAYLAMGLAAADRRDSQAAAEAVGAAVDAATASGAVGPWSLNLDLIPRQEPALSSR